MLTFLFLSIMTFHAAMPVPIQKDSQKAALQEEVNILVYGVLQFSNTLHSFYESTTEKLARIKHSTDLYEQGLRMLHHLTQSAKQNQRKIHRALTGLKAENMRLQQQTECNKEMLQEVFGGHQNLEQQVKALEEKLLSMEKQSFQNEAALKAHMQQQNFTIWFLREATQQQQQQQMVQQSEQLLQTQEQVPS